MAGTTTNNSWTYPTSTDLVKDGASAIQTLATGIDTSTGKGLVAWQTWAPTLSGGWLNGNGVWDAKYCQIGKSVLVSASFTLGTTTTKGTGLTCSLPVTAKNAHQYGASVVSTVAGGSYPLNVLNSSTTTFQLVVPNAAGTYVSNSTLSATVPATWATGNSFLFNLMYEAA
jgi:hypothetical protein